jgi:mannose-6-phosphate isomerase-like protein (cupin superfamily)
MFFRMAQEMYQARYKTAQEIRRHGAIGNLQDGPTIETHGIATRLIAWPGNGYQTESVHVLTLQPGDESASYCYSVAEEALLCLQGTGQVYLRGQWVVLEPGDIAYFPEGVPHATRNPQGQREPFILVSQITPPQIDLYQDQGFYHRDLGVFNGEAIRKATINARRSPLPRVSQMGFRDTYPEHRVWNLTSADVRRAGALFNVYMGTEWFGLGLPGRLILWPGAGTRNAGFNYVLAPAGVPDIIHTHPTSDECLVLWEGTARGYMGQGWIDLEMYDCILAPCGVVHGHRSETAPSVLGGFASPPQLDLLMLTDFYRDGVFSEATWKRLREVDCPGVERLRETAAVA